MLQKSSPSKQETPAGIGQEHSFFRHFTQTVTTHKIGDLLVAGGIISPEQLEAALTEQRQQGGQLGAILLHQKALTTVQLYHKLAEQWCLRVATTGVAMLMQMSMPLPAHADEANGEVTNVAMQFTLAAGTSRALAHQYPELFGTRETRSNDITAFKKWTDVMHRFDAQMHSRASSDPRVIAWEARLESLRGKSHREQIDGINTYINQLRYIEDIDNYNKTDYWATPVEFLTRGGDCEDFAIAKYASLRALGFSTDQLRVAIVTDKIKHVPHAILIVYSNEGNFVLDNQDKRVEPITAVNRYQPIFSINSTSWWLHRA